MVADGRRDAGDGREAPLRAAGHSRQPRSWTWWRQWRRLFPLAFSASSSALLASGKRRRHEGLELAHSCTIPHWEPCLIAHAGPSLSPVWSMPVQPVGHNQGKCCPAPQWRFAALERGFILPNPIVLLAKHHISYDGDGERKIDTSSRSPSGYLMGMQRGDLIRSPIN